MYTPSTNADGSVKRGERALRAAGLIREFRGSPEHTENAEVHTEEPAQCIRDAANRIHTNHAGINPTDSANPGKYDEQCQEHTV